MPISSRSPEQIILTHDALTGGAAQESANKSPLAGGVWLHGNAIKDGVEYRFAKGTLAEFAYLSADLLLDGDQLAVFSIGLREGDTGPEFSLIFGALNQCQARLRLPLSAVDQNQWMLGREGALLKRICAGARVDLSQVDRMQIRIERCGPKRTRWCLTPVTVSKSEPALLTAPLLPAGPLIDAIGQSTLHTWAGKTPSGVALHHRLGEQLQNSTNAQWPAGFSRWGGHGATNFGGTGFFRTHHDGRRWWMVDPDGCAFWSAGPDCVSMSIDSAIAGIRKAAKWLPAQEGLFGNAWSPRRSESANFLITNFIRVFGEKWYDNWTKITLANMKRIGFNTVANWSDWKIAQAASFPYVRPMEFTPKRTPCVYRDFPDVFAPTLHDDAREYAAQLSEHAGDPAFIGYFLMNEPTWGFASDTPAEGMLFNTERCACRDELANSLQTKYTDDAALAKAWNMPATLASVRAGKWHGKITDACREDLVAFSTVMVDHYFGTLSAACKAADPDHINLGARYYTVPPKWALEGMKSFDVFSINCYRQQVPAEQLQLIEQVTGKPTMIGEWHFGALDVGLPASGIGHVASQADRGRAYRFYLEQAAALPQCIGVHWFTLYDQSAVGRFDGENYNIGFFDVCNRPYEELCAAALLAHTHMYEVASGKQPPFNDPPQHFPMLFM